jgi:hypothetical protein
VGVLVAACAIGLAIVAVQTPAQAACHEEVTDVYVDKDGKIVYVTKTVCDDKADGHGGSTSSGGGKPDTCHLQPETRVVKGASWCSGDSLCYIDESKSQDDPAVYPPPPGPKPAPPDKYVYLFCYLPPNVQGPVVGRWVLNSAAHEPSPLDLARQSFGSLQADEAQIRTSPAGKTVVNLDTWFTLGGPAEIRGTQAGSLVAKATLDSTEWQFGDGSSLPCTALQVALGSKGCAHTYKRAAPVTVTVTRTYKVRYEVNGVVQTIDDAPTAFTAPAASVPLVVTEIQTTVTGDR